MLGSGDQVILREINRLNAHLPKRRVTLAEALEKPEVELANGGKHRFRRSELELLKSLLPPGEWGKLKLPIMIELDPRLGRGTARVRGSYECKVIAKLLGKEPAEELLLYRPELAQLRDRLSTVTEYCFVA